jgi:hypothetical protein
LDPAFQNDENGYMVCDDWTKNLWVMLTGVPGALVKKIKRNKFYIEKRIF